MGRQQKTVYLDDETIDYLEGSAKENDTSFNEEIRSALGFAIQWYRVNGGDTASIKSEIYSLQQEIHRRSSTISNLNQQMGDLIQQLPEEEKEEFEYDPDADGDWLDQAIGK